MGACFSNCFKSKEEDRTESYVQNVMSCKAGKTGKKIMVTNDDNIISLSGSGTFLGSYALECDSAYWEVKIGLESSGIKLGIKRYDDKAPVSLDGSLKEEDNAWILNDTSLIKDDIIGIYWDQTDFPMLSFSKNGVMLDKCSVSRIRPANNVYPAVSLEAGSTCAVAFIDNDFKYAPSNKQKFKMIVGASSLI